MNAPRVCGCDLFTLVIHDVRRICSDSPIRCLCIYNYIDRADAGTIHLCVLQKFACIHWNFFIWSAQRQPVLLQLDCNRVDVHVFSLDSHHLITFHCVIHNDAHKFHISIDLYWGFFLLQPFLFDFMSVALNLFTAFFLTFSPGLSRTFYFCPFLSMIPFSLLLLSLLRPSSYVMPLFLYSFSFACVHQLKRNVHVILRRST